MTTTPLPELTVEEFISKQVGRHCEFAPVALQHLGECQAAIAYTVTPSPYSVPMDEDYTSFVCREHLGELIALRLAGKYDVPPS